MGANRGEAAQKSIHLITRANHPLLPGRSNENEKGLKKSSTKRLASLRRALSTKALDDFRDGEGAPCEPGSWAVHTLTKSKTVCNPCSLATVVCDVGGGRRYLHVEYKQRVLASRRLQRQLVKRLEGNEGVAAVALVNGHVECREGSSLVDANEPRLLSGKPERHACVRICHRYELV